MNPNLSQNHPIDPIIIHIGDQEPPSPDNSENNCQSNSKIPQLNRNEIGIPKQLESQGQQYLEQENLKSRQEQENEIGFQKHNFSEKKIDSEGKDSKETKSFTSLNIESRQGHFNEISIDKTLALKNSSEDEESPNYKSNSQRANPLSFLFFWFEAPIVRKAKVLSKQGKSLNENDLPGLAYQLRAEILGSKLQKNLEEQKKKNPKKSPNLAIAIIQTCKWQILFCILLETLFLFLRVFSAWVAYKLLKALGDVDGTEEDKFKWAGVMTAVLLLALFAEHHSFYQKTLLPLYIRGALISMIYDKITNLSIYSMNQISLGRLVNIVANDVNVFERTGLFFTCLVTAPLLVVAVTALLWHFFNVTVLIGVGYVVLTFPILKIFAKLSNKPRDRQNQITDERVKLTNEIIEGIRLLKMYTWELIFRDTVKETRKKEIKYLGQVHDLECTSRGISYSTQAVGSFLMFMLYNVTGGTLELYTVFPAYYLIGLLRLNSAFFFSMGVNFLAEAKLFVQRASKILDVQELAEIKFEEPKDPENALEFENYTGYWSKELDNSIEIDLKDKKIENEPNSIDNEAVQPTLKDINLNIRRGTLNAIIGVVGCGKTSILLSFTGEIPKTTGSLRFKGSVAYVEQEPTIFAGTFRENILFGKSFHQNFYQKVIKTCNLESDFELFANGDMTQVGEKGNNLSGGQKARLALARAIYSDADIYLLDDPLSAVDTKVAKSLYNDAIKTVLKNKTVILATHQVHFIKDLESIIVMDEGRVVAHGSYEQLQTQYKNIDKIFPSEKEKEQLEIIKNKRSKNEKVLAQKTEFIEDQKKEKVDEDEDEDEDDGDDDDDENGEEKPSQTIETFKGTVTMRTYWKYIKAMGGPFTFFIFFYLFITCEMANVGFARILAAWAAEEFTLGRSLGIMGGLAGYIFVVYIVKNVYFAWMLLRASQKHHNKMLDRIVRSPVLFFDTNSIGTILNRFSNDIGVLDRFLPHTALDFVDALFLIGALIIALGIVMPWLLLPIGGALLLIGILLITCYESIKQCRNYELTSRSPLYSLFSATLSGMIVIRGYKQEEHFKDKFRKFMNNNTKGSVSFWVTSRFFGFFVDLSYFMSGIGNIFILTSLNSDPGLSGFALILIISINSILQYGLRQLVQTHVLMSSVARVQAYCEAPSEAAVSLETDQEIQQKGWPQKGQVQFNSVYMKYRPELDYVIKGLTFEAKPGEKIGCVGRTGAGKSSIIQILFRLVEIERNNKESQSGSLKIDEVDIQTLGLHLLRNSISIIPQTPFIFTGTVRRNLDPIGNCTDEDCWRALEDVNLKEHVQKLDNGLETDMTNASSVFSVGQKQLVCLARTILKKSKVLVLDEATANVDLETDNFIQQKIIEKFKDCTIFTIAHRLSTIANYDKVLVLSKGQKVEFDLPYNLLVKSEGDDKITNTEGHFASMVLNTGPKTSMKIFEIAKEHYEGKKIMT